MAKTIAKCARCGQYEPIAYRGMCYPCYMRDLAGVPQVDCFALDARTSAGRCKVTGLKCRMQSVNPERRNCPFIRTKEEYGQSCMRATERIARLPEEQRQKIIEKYLMQTEGEE